MIEFYYKLVKFNKLDIEKVPDKYRNAVKVRLQSSGI